MICAVMGRIGAGGARDAPQERTSCAAGGICPPLEEKGLRGAGGQTGLCDGAAEETVRRNGIIDADWGWREISGMRSPGGVSIRGSWGHHGKEQICGKRCSCLAAAVSTRAGENAGDTAPEAGERQEDFEDLIRGRYKADFDARVRKILDGRLRGLRQEVAQLRQWERAGPAASGGHGTAVPPGAGDQRCIRNSGGSGRWTTPGFARLIDAGVEPREAYEMVHRRELTAKAMHFAAQMAARQAARVVASGGSASGKIPDAVPASAARTRGSSPARSWRTSAGESWTGRGSAFESFQKMEVFG